MPEWKAAMILPMLYLHENLIVWNRIAHQVEEMGLSSSAFAAARTIITIYDLHRTELRSES